MSDTSRSDQLTPPATHLPEPHRLRPAADLGGALEAAGIGAWRADLASGTIDATAQARALFGLADAQTATPAELLDRIHPDDRGRLIAAATHIADPSTPRNHVIEVRAVNDGRIRWLRIQAHTSATGGSAADIVGTIAAMGSEETGHVHSAAAHRLSAELATAWAVFCQLPVAIAVLDDDLRFVHCNDALATLIGLPLAALIRAEQATVIPEFHAATDATLERARTTGKPVYDHLVHTGLTDDGRPRWLRCSWIPLIDGDAKIPYVIATIDDVTEHHAAQLALAGHRESLSIQARELQAYFHHVPVGLAVVDQDLRYVRVNERFAEMSGQPAAVHPGRGIAELDPSCASNAVAHIRRALERQQPVLEVEFDSHGEDPTCPTRHWRCSYIPLPDPTDCNQAVICMVQDITIAHRAETAVRANERRMSALANSVPAMVWSAQAEGRTDYCNQRMCDFLGRAAPELYGEAWLGAVHEADRHRIRRAWREALNTGSRFEAELRLQRHDGVHLWHRARIVPHRDEQKRVDRWYATATDIDATKRTELDLADHARALERSNRELNQFASFISHDLRAPLRMVGTYLDLIAESVEPPGQAFIDKAQGALQRMRQLIEAVLSYARLGREVSLHMVYVPAASLVDAACETLAPVIAETGARIDVDPLPEVYADAVLLGQCVQNLIENAIKHGTAPVHLRIGAQQTGRAGSWILRFADNGPGIPEAMRKRVFDPFFRLDAGTDGSGIGLAFGAKIIRLHGGDIWIEESELGGATFCLRLHARPCAG